MGMAIDNARMDAPNSAMPFSVEQANDVSLRAGKAFVPHTPVSTRELFSGRWDQITAVADAVLQVGLHVVIYGERGVGKTSLANILRPLIHAFDGHKSDGEEASERLVVKVNACEADGFSALWTRAFGEITWQEERPTMGFIRTGDMQAVTLSDKLSLPAELSIDHVRRLLMQLPGSIFIFDEFDRIAHENARPFTDLIKALSDYSTDTTIIIVGVADTIDGLVEDHASIVRALIQVPLPRMNQRELEEIIRKGEAALHVSFDPNVVSRIVRMSQGLAHYTHLTALLAVREACKERTRTVTIRHADRAFAGATKQAEQSILNKFSVAVHSAHKDALYSHVLLACALAASASTNDLGFFQASDVVDPLSQILPGRTTNISTFNQHLAGFCTERRGEVLEQTGPKRGYRYRFPNPLLPPYVIMRGLSCGMISQSDVDQFLSARG